MLGQTVGRTVGEACWRGEERSVVASVAQRVFHRVRPRSLGDLSWTDAQAILRRTGQEVFADDVPSLSAAVAFKIFLALFPALVAAIGIYGIVSEPGEIANQIDTLTRLLPQSAQGTIDEALGTLTSNSNSAEIGALLLGLGGALFSISGASATLVRALNAAYDVTERRPLLRQRGTGLLLAGALLLAIVAVVVTLVAGPQIRDWMLPPALVSGPVRFLFSVGQVLVAVGVLIALFAFVYWTGPNRPRPRWQWLSPGAVVGVLGWLLLAGLFNLYVGNLGSYEVYGIFGGVIVLLLWLQLTMAVLLVGAELNAEIERRRDQRREAQLLAEGAGTTPPTDRTGSPSS